jgi:hypothetical protein
MTYVLIVKAQYFFPFDYEHIVRIFPTADTDHIIVAWLIKISNIFTCLYNLLFELPCIEDSSLLGCYRDYDHSDIWNYLPSSTV